MSCIELQEPYRHIDNYFIRYARNIENLPSDFKKIYIEYARQLDLICNFCAKDKRFYLKKVLNRETNTRIINTITTNQNSLRDRIDYESYIKYKDGGRTLVMTQQQLD